MLLGQKITERVAEMRTLPAGIDQRSACRHPDWTGPDDLTIKIEELRELTDWEKPVFVKIGASRPRFDVQLAVKAGADVVVLDGMQGGAMTHPKAGDGVTWMRSCSTSAIRATPHNGPIPRYY